MKLLLLGLPAAAAFSWPFAAKDDTCPDSAATIYAWAKTTTTFADNTCSEAPGGAACTGTHVSRTEERPACWTDFRGLVTAPLADLDPADHLTDPRVALAMAGHVASG